MITRDDNLSWRLTPQTWRRASHQPVPGTSRPSSEWRALHSVGLLLARPPLARCSLLGKDRFAAGYPCMEFRAAAATPTFHGKAPRVSNRLRLLLREQPNRDDGVLGQREFPRALCGEGGFCSGQGCILSWLALRVGAEEIGDMLTRADARDIDERQVVAPAERFRMRATPGFLQPSVES